MPQSILLNDIIEPMMQRIGLPPLLVIMTEARRMTYWGYFLAFYKNKRQTIAALNEKSLLAYQYSVSYTHLDVYKRQPRSCGEDNTVVPPLSVQQDSSPMCPLSLSRCV